MPSSALGTNPPPETLQQALKEIERLNRRVQRERLSRLEAEEMAEQAMRIAVEDPLTKLANRNMLSDQLQLEIEIARRRNSKLLVLYMDLDGFKTVNDTYGHEMGDNLLCHVADTLKHILRPDDVIARLGGDEFVVISTGVEENDAENFVRRLQKSLQLSPLQKNGLSLPLRASIGATVVDGNLSVDDALHQADTAMYQAKQHTLDGCFVFNEQLALDDEIRRHTLRALPSAVKNDELIIHYQPIVDVHTGYIDQIESLVRWQRNGSLLPPKSFISIAEESGLINDIGRFVLEQSLRDISYWHKHLQLPPHGLPKVAINISSKQLLNPHFARDIQQLMKSQGLTPSMLSLEITETTLLAREPATTSNLHQLAQAGHLLALDDFGTDGLSLTVLRDVTFNTVKIDRSFVDVSLDNKKDQAIVRAINTIASTLGARTVVEGIETQAQLHKAFDLGCDYVQGFLMSRALPAEQIEALFDTYFHMPTESLNANNTDHEDNVISWPISKQWRWE